jgi:hypothetical protein
MRYTVTLTDGDKLAVQASNVSYVAGEPGAYMMTDVNLGVIAAFPANQVARITADEAVEIIETLEQRARIGHPGLRS